MPRITKAMRAEMLQNDIRVLEEKYKDERYKLDDEYPRHTKENPIPEAYWNKEDEIYEQHQRNLYNLYIVHKIEVPWGLDKHIKGMATPESRAEYYAYLREK